MEKPLAKILKLENPVSDAVVSKITDEQWEIVTGRQDVFMPHRETKSIFLKSVPDPVAKDDRDMMFETGHLRTWDECALYQESIDSILNELSNLYEIEEWAASLIMLPAGKEIYKHRDVYPAPENLKRMHIPVQTNPQVIFQCGKVSGHLELDTVYEVRNLTYMHRVINGGTTDRIHLIIDIDASLKS